MQNADLTEKAKHYKKIKKIKNNIKKLLSYKKVGKEILTFGDIEIENNNFFCNKIPIFF